MKRKNIPWDFYSMIMIIIYAMLQVIRWAILPQSMDIYYHLLTAWGFNQAGGYSGWDFWQYAPLGRAHIYPPFFHIILALPMKLGISVTILAKFCETIAPIVFLLTLWFFIRNNFGKRISFFVILVFSSSFHFYMSLMNHLPATLGLIFGILCIGLLLQRSLLRSAILLTLCFYTHIGVSWFFATAIFIYGLLDKKFTRMALKVIILSFIFSSPVLYKEIYGFRFISALGFEMKEANTYQINVLNYVLAFAGLILILFKEKKYRIFAGTFLASLIFLIYPYRFFSAEGYLPVILLVGFFLDYIYGKLQDSQYISYVFITAVLFMSLLSPSIARYTLDAGAKGGYKIIFFDSAFLGMLFGKGESIWFPKDYLPASRIIKDNSGPDDIVYSPFNLVGVILSAISGRATANALFPEISPPVTGDPYVSSKVIIFNRLDDNSLTGDITNKYGLKKIGETKTFILYINSRCLEKINRKSASLPFWVTSLAGAALLLLYLAPKKKRPKNI